MASQPTPQLGPVLLSGLIIGPILGSGIVILPPLAYRTAGDWALLAWLLIILAGFGFALVFGRLSLLYPGPAGVTTAIGVAFGERVKLLTSLYLTGAVLFGPVAVMLTAATYLCPGSPRTNWIAGGLLLICAALLLRELRHISRIGLVCSSLAALILVSGGLDTLLLHRIPLAAFSTFDPPAFGYALLLLFWTIVGWEVIGNYSGEVRHPQRTIMVAVKCSAVVIGVISLIVAAAVQYGDPGIYPQTGQVTRIIVPLYGSASGLLMGGLTLALCITTCLLFVGGVARLIAALAAEGWLPALLARRSSTGAPVYALMLLTMAHLAALGLVEAGWVGIEQLVAFADGFFLANASIGLLAAYRLIPCRWVRLTAAALGCFFVVTFCHSPLWVIVTVLAAAGYFLVRRRPGPKAPTL